jgi:BMFP domain-containing protein YqiC
MFFRIKMAHHKGALSRGLEMDVGRPVSYRNHMLDAKVLDDIARRLSGAMPAAAKTLGDDLDKNLRTATQAVFARLDLVTREEFDVQRKVLARSREKIEQLERTVAALEAQLLEK